LGIDVVNHAVGAVATRIGANRIAVFPIWRTVAPSSFQNGTSRPDCLGYLRPRHVGAMDRIDGPYWNDRHDVVPE
jgi:hypothetical protein